MKPFTESQRKHREAKRRGRCNELWFAKVLNADLRSYGAKACTDMIVNKLFYLEGKERENLPDWLGAAIRNIKVNSGHEPFARIKKNPKYLADFMGQAERHCPDGCIPLVGLRKLYQHWGIILWRPADFEQLTGYKAGKAYYIAQEVHIFRDWHIGKKEEKS